MSRSNRIPIYWPLWLFFVALNGCAVPAHFCDDGCLSLQNATMHTQPSVAPVPSSGVQQTSFQSLAQPTVVESKTLTATPAFIGLGELSVEPLIEQVLLRNPSLAQMTATWQAASARYPQVTSLDDPMFGATIGPASFGSKEVDGAYRLEVSQKIPYPGKRELKGQAALAESAAACNDVNDMRLQLIESAKNAFYEYYLVTRAIAVNAESLRLLSAFREEAKTRYEKALVPQQDVLQADVELGRQRERGLILERMRRVAIARINTLMHLSPDSLLPPVPDRLAPLPPLPPVDVIRSCAQSQRPDLQALANRIAADEATLRLAQKEFCPDFEVMAAYDAFWQQPEKDLRTMVGVRMNLPIQKERRLAAVAEAQARIAERRAQLDSRIDQVNLQLQEAYEQVKESEQILKLYESSILPTARNNVEAARSAYVTGKSPFLSLVEAQRNQVQLLDRFYEAQADYFKRWATLERVAGGQILYPVAVVPAN